MRKKLLVPASSCLTKVQLNFEVSDWDGFGDLESFLPLERRDLSGLGKEAFESKGGTTRDEIHVEDFLIFHHR